MHALIAREAACEGRYGSHRSGRPGLLYLGLHDDARAWKGFDWAAMERLHAKGLITNPINKAKLVSFTEEGLREARRRFQEMFVVADDETSER